ncbi:inosine triphosphate pyrophosphatase-like [Octopus sinensis]|uniref:XTP/dITP diphosphatase n=1 Tax=Octopus sinensis TaxID=2607531 RepID=A0A6P7U3Y6_9MOLL|nr:inosine triphosphate pyrophosphatase-like [Octopus sinensis]
MTVEYKWVISENIDLPEYQGTPEDIATLKIKKAFKILKRPVLCEDTSLAFHALGGMPGPYVKWFLDKIGPAGLFKLLEGFESKKATASTIFAFYDGNDIRLFRGDVEGEIVEPRGSSSFGWDPCFQPLCSDKTYGEMTVLEKQAVSHRSAAFNKLKPFLNDFLL